MQGLKKAVSNLLPQVEHRNCARHIYANWRKRFGSLELKRIFWEAACATHDQAHKRAMREMKRLDAAAHDKILEQDSKLWSKAYFVTHSKADNVENNMSECFNAWIIKARYIL